MLACLRELDAAMRDRGGGLVVRHGRPERELVALAGEAGASAVLWTSDVSPYARARDARVTEALGEAGIDAMPCSGNYCVDISRPRTRDGRPFRVFSPFWRAWREVERRPVHRAPPELPAAAERRAQGPAAVAGGARRRRATCPSRPSRPARTRARAALARWLDGARRPLRRAPRHAGRRDERAVALPALGLPVAARVRGARDRARRARAPRAWVRQLCWRDFYAHVLLAHPESATPELQERYRGALEWDDDDERLAAWQEGRTGFPLVDAGMRQLARTGWMHNRARLVVGSFLTKDLHLDWRQGEAWFARLLLTASPRRTTATGSGSARSAPIRRRLTGGCTTRPATRSASTPTARTCAAGCPSCATCRSSA